MPVTQHLPRAPKVPIAQIFTNLHGNWKFQRSIVNFAQNNLGGSVKGSARFNLQSPDQYLCNERGILQTGSGSFRVSQEFVYVFKHENQTIEVQNPRGEVLFSLDFSTNNDIFVAQGSHQCGKDYYLATFSILRANSFKSTIGVRGPRKNYYLQTAFTKIA